MVGNGQKLGAGTAKAQSPKQSKNCILVKDFGEMDVLAQVHMDATAAHGIIERQGFARISHLDANVLWLQQR